jgi:hypothetical protein
MTSNFKRNDTDLYSSYDRNNIVALPFNHYTIGGSTELDDNFSLYVHGTRVNSGFLENGTDLGSLLQVDPISKIVDIAYNQSTTTQTNVFTHTGSNQTFTVPANVSYMTAQVWGAGGGGSGNGNIVQNLNGGGGGGGYTSANLTVTSGTTLTIIVGQAGTVSAAGATVAGTYGGGGGTQALNGDANWRNTSGGGRSAIRIGTTEIITAGGGGGGGKRSTSSTGDPTGGAGGGTTGGHGNNGVSTDTVAGGGGTQTAGGAAASKNEVGTAATAGSQFQGGLGSQYAGGGGGGWYGGGGGGIQYYSNTNTGGGGGGSSYVSPTYLQAGTTATFTQASGSTVAANTSLPAAVQGTIGNGGAGGTGGSGGQNGYVVLTFYFNLTANNTVYQYARWIWGNKIMEGINEGYAYWFYYTFYYDGNTNTGTIYGACDDAAYLYFNNTAIGSISGNYNTGASGATNNYSVSIVKGLNYIRVAAYNGGSTKGFSWRRFGGYHSENPSYDSTATATHTSNGITDFTNVSTATGGIQAVNGSEGYSIFWYGDFLSDFTGTWTFGLNSDDGSYLWLGDAALTGYTAANSLINNGGAHGMFNKTGSIALVSGTSYPIRIMFGEIGGGDDCKLYWSKDGDATRSYDFSGKVSSIKFNPGALIVALYDSRGIATGNIANSNGNWVYSNINPPYNTGANYTNTNGALTFNSTSSETNTNRFKIPSGVTGTIPLFYYPFWFDTRNYASGTGVIDSTLGGGTRVSISPTTSYRSYSVNSLYSSNVSSNMSLLTPIPINTAIGFTVCFWYYITSSAAGMLWTINSLTTTTRAFIYNTGTKIRVTVNYVGSPKAGDNDIYNLTLNTWTFIALVQPAGGIPYVSLNNGTTTNLTNYGALNFTSSYHLIFGDPLVGSSYGGAVGYMNNFYYFNRALSAAEITAIYNQ